MPQKWAGRTGREGWKNWDWKNPTPKSWRGGKLHHKPLKEGKNCAHWKSKEGKNWKSKQVLPVCSRLENEEEPEIAPEILWQVVGAVSLSERE